ncbi:MAG: purine/pyrimidine permease [Myxococcales bacterium]|nr:purine/pyrimidine permease [Myxococcales bacterium]
MASEGLIYGIDDKPPLIETIGLGFQHYLTMFGSTLAIPYLVGGYIGLPKTDQAFGWLIGTLFFVSGITTLLQTTLGNRLPIIQGGTFSFLGPTKGLCQSKALAHASWQLRMQNVQGAIISGAFVEIFLGFTGLLGRLLRSIGPITIAPTIALIGLSLYEYGAPKAGTHWGIGALTIGLIILFSQYLRRTHRIFELFPILLAILIAWGTAAILTVTGVFGPGHPAHVSTAALAVAPWFRLPYPGQWGMPKFSLPGFVTFLAGYLSSIVESVGDYYACARLAGAGIPTKQMINRGIGMEGVGCLVAGAFGTGNATTSYSENIGAIGLTRVGSRVVVQAGAILMLVLGAVGKFGALFATVPDPIVGGMYCAMFGMIAAVGLSNLQFVDLNSARNLFILGFAFFMGLSLPIYVVAHPLSFDPQWLADIINILGRKEAGMAVAALIAVLLDNTIPGTPEERGLSGWHG